VDLPKSKSKDGPKYPTKVSSFPEMIEEHNSQNKAGVGNNSRNALLKMGVFAMTFGLLNWSRELK